MEAAAIGNLELFNHIEFLLRNKFLYKNLLSKVVRVLFFIEIFTISYLKNFTVDRFNILHAAVLGQNLDLVRKIHENYKIKLNSSKNLEFRINNTKLTYRVTPLSLAVMCGNQEITGYLLEKGAAISATKVMSVIGYQIIPSPLFFAILSDNVSMIKFLLDHGADINDAVSQMKCN